MARVLLEEDNIVGLFSGETALELKGDAEDEVAVGLDQPLLPPPVPPVPLLLLVMLLMVFDIVCLAACFARSVDTKLLTRSFRFPFISGEARRSRVPPSGPLLWPYLLGEGLGPEKADWAWAICWWSLVGGGGVEPEEVEE